MPGFRVASTVAALAVALTGLLPFEHVHAEEHRQVVHRHVIGGDGPHHHGVNEQGSIISDTEHADALFVSVSWVTGLPFSLAGPVAKTTGPVAEPRHSRATLTLGMPILPTHDPPLRFTSSPAPPAAL